MIETSLGNICHYAASAGSRAAAKCRLRKARTKADEYVGHHAITTRADFKSQKAILDVITRLDEESLFLNEEKVSMKSLQHRLIKSSNLDQMSDSRVYIIDDLDGSSSRKVGHYEWSVSVACVENLVHYAGAIFAPDVYDGLIFSTEKGKGAFLESRSGQSKMKVSDCSLPTEAYILVGADYFLSQYSLGKIGDSARTVNSTGSCALGLGMVAAGRADALVQPLQSPWDWAAGKLIVEEAGGTVIFYEMDDGKIEPVELQKKHYNPDKRAVGFVAGNKQLANKIFEMLRDGAKS